MKTLLRALIRITMNPKHPLWQKSELWMLLVILMVMVCTWSYFVVRVV